VWGLGRPGGQGGLLPQPQHLWARGETPVRGGELGHRALHGGINVSGAGGERGEQPVLNTVDLEGRGAPLTPIPPPPGDGEPGGEVVGDRYSSDSATPA
jgi:hypothetical protein